MKEWHFEEKVYKRWVVLMICSHEEFVEAMREARYIYADDLKKASGRNVRLTHENSDHAMTVLWLPEFSASVLAHELVHLVMSTFHNAGTPISYENEESFAYYLEYWFREMSRVYKKYPDGTTPAIARGLK